MLDEIEMINKGLNPLMSWAEELAETIVKAVTANNTDFETIFKKYAPGKNFISEKQFMNAMKDMRVESKFDRNKIMRFYYYIDEDKSQKVEFREMESIIKTHCKRTVKELSAGVILAINSQMDERRIGFEKFHSTLKDYSRAGLIDVKSFRKGISQTMKLKVNDIDLDFLCQAYKDKTDKRSINLKKFMSDFADQIGFKDKSILERTLTNHKNQPRSTTSPVPKVKGLTRGDFSSPQKKNDEIDIIMRELKVEAHDRRIDLEKEFKRTQKDGQLTEKEFKDTLYDCGIKMNGRDVQKITDRFINTISNTVDTNVLVNHMNDKFDTNRQLSSRKKLAKIAADPNILGKIARKLYKKGLIQKVIKNLQNLDKNEEDHLSFDNIKKALHRADFKLSDSQVEEMLSEIKMNERKEYNYHILLCSLFGESYNKEIVIDGKVIPVKSKFSKSDQKPNDRRRTRNRGDRNRLDTNERNPRAKPRRGANNKSAHKGRNREVVVGRSTGEVGNARHGSRRKIDFDSEEELIDTRGKGRPTSKGGMAKTPIGKQAKEIGRLLEESRYNFYAHLRHYAGEDKDYTLTDDQIFKILGAAKIKISRREEDDFIRDMGDIRFTVEEFLTNCNLNLGEFGGEKVDVEVTLSPEEKENAKKLCSDIGHAIDHENKEFERIFNIGPYDKDTDFYEFKFGIENEINDD